MSYDFYVDFQIEKDNSSKSKVEISELTTGAGKYTEIEDISSRIALLSTAYAIKNKLPDRKGRPNKIEPDVYARVGEGDYPSGLKALIHSNGNYNDYMKCKLSELNLLGINLPINISSLPKGSWVLEFPITLKKPFISKDDVPLYIIENPVRKDKIFNVPFTSATSWKGNLRWTMMKTHLEPKADNPDEFVETRFKHTLLFGTEKGMEEVAKGWTEYLDNLCPEAKDKYRNKLKERSGRDEVPSLSGMLYFYPAFWDRIDMEVINPQDRKTKTGKNPIYYEVVPAGAKGVFRLLYIPFYYIGKDTKNLKENVMEDLEMLVDGLKEMMLTYGFSAKKSSGYGVIEDKWDKAESRLAIKNFSDTVKFSNFEELKQEVEKLQEAKE